MAQGSTYLEGGFYLNMVKVISSRCGVLGEIRDVWWLIILLHQWRLSALVSIVQEWRRIIFSGLNIFIVGAYLAEKLAVVGIKIPLSGISPVDYIALSTCSYPYANIRRLLAVWTSWTAVWIDISQQTCCAKLLQTNWTHREKSWRICPWINRLVKQALLAGWSRAKNATVFAFRLDLHNANSANCGWMGKNQLNVYVVFPRDCAYPFFLLKWNDFLFRHFQKGLRSH